MPEVRMYEHDVCDFCSDPHPVRRFAAPDFMMAKDAPPAKSTGAWAACETCGTMIDHGLWNSLETRARKALEKKYAGLVPQNAIRDQIRKAHALFRQHMRRDA